MTEEGLISLVEREHVLSMLDHNKRIDGRNFDEFREITIIPNYIQKAEGSAIVKIGKTKVIVGIKASLGDPYPDTPETGVLTTTVELSAYASPNFESGPPRADAIELARVTDRPIREAKAVNNEQLVIIPGKKVWVLFIDIYILDHDGNLFDACEMATLAALKNTKLPDTKIVKDENGLEDVEILETSKPLKMDHQPISCTIAKIGKHLIVDPTLKEENTQDARITFAFTENNKICSTQKGENGTFSIEEIETAIDLAAKKTKEIRSKWDDLTNPEAFPWVENE
ncbi:MAG: exosome complex protein Rrp42 [Asgard group archaeon]|nr:exosome complex protein Rrp42 [Asgard group archaeon]